MAKILHDVCDTSKMQGVYQPALIETTGVAEVDLDNGRIAVFNVVDETVKYATKTDKVIYLIKSVEQNYDNVRMNLGDFYNQAGKKVRLFRIVNGDEFATSACPEGVKVEDALQVGTDGKLVTYVDGAWKFTVVELAFIGNRQVAVVKAELV